MARIDGGPGEYAPYPEMKIGNFERYEYSGKGLISANASAYLQVGASEGVCLMPMMFFGNFPLLDFINAVTGWDADTASPTDETLEKLGLGQLVAEFG